MMHKTFFLHLFLQTKKQICPIFSKAKTCSRCNTEKSYEQNDIAKLCLKAHGFSHAELSNRDQIFKFFSKKQD